uniref:Outer capsid glycoprotein VP7 n=1 Tax=Human rotavirus A TaxID=10941 RepID=A0A2K9UWV9_9REOV|nr:VP7 [Human rotavirus A]
MYGIEYTTILTILISIILLNYILKTITNTMDYIIFKLLLLIALISPFVRTQNYGIYLPITGSLDAVYMNSTSEEPFLTSTLCLYYPAEAKNEISDDEWENTLSQLFSTKGWPTGSVYFKDYNDITTFPPNPQLSCDYNVVLMRYDNTSELDASELADLILNEWLCNPMDISLYSSQQSSESNKWISMGTDCTVKACPLPTQTPGIGCKTTDVDTFEIVASSQKLAITDVVNGVNHKPNISISTCPPRTPNKLGPRENVAPIQVGGPTALDLTADPTTVPQVQRIMRINWKKCRQVFYTVVDYINQIIQVMSKRSRSLDTAAFYYRI